MTENDRTTAPASGFTNEDERPTVPMIPVWNQPKMRSFDTAAEAFFAGAAAHEEEDDGDEDDPAAFMAAMRRRSYGRLVAVLVALCSVMFAFSIAK